MTNKEYYADHSWIKVKRHKDDESKSWEDRYYALDDHHVKETTFLINEIRTLAEKLDTVEIKDKKKERTKECIRSFFVFWFGFSALISMIINAFIDDQTQNAYHVLILSISLVCGVSISSLLTYFKWKKGNKDTCKGNCQHRTCKAMRRADAP